MDKEKFDEVILREKERRISINRIPKQTKEEFVELANSEFCEDYGLTLKYVWDSFKIGKLFVENLSYKLDEILLKLNLITEEKPDEEDSLTMLSGRKVKKEVKK